MHGLIPIEAGSKCIQFLCKPLELIMPANSVGRVLQGIHIVGFFLLVTAALLYEDTQIYVAGFYIALIIMFFLFGGCILTKAEMHYLGRKETIPSLTFNALGIIFPNKETDYYWQKMASLGVILTPIILIIIYRIMKSKPLF
jgi:hypothetical protein